MPKKGLLLVLADGMGGRAGGAEAARTAVDVMMEEYYRDKTSNIPESLKNAFLKANREVISKGDKDISLQGMATTLSSVVLKKDRMYFAHVGDSRGYLISDGEMLQFTEDHSIVAGLVKAGYITEEEAPAYPGNNVITRAIGINDELKIDAPEQSRKIKPGQYIMLCCDGLHKEIPDDEMLRVFQEVKEPSGICEKLVEKALANEGDDNITVLIARIDKTGFFAGLLG
jgi:protein phosphatase